MNTESQRKLIGIDIGGTHIKAILTNESGIILDEASCPTRDKEGVDNSAVWKAAVRELIQQMRASADEEVTCVGISSPGTVNKKNSAVLSNGSKLLGIEDLVWSDFLGFEVYVLNDAHSALFAESRLGAGKTFNSIIMITLGTGVGGGIMIDSQLWQGVAGRAGHIGHMSTNLDPLTGIVGTPGSLENSVGECSLSHRSHGRFSTTKALVDAYERGGHFATWVWLNSIHSLARGIISLVNVISPEIIILGGGITKAGQALMNPLNEFLEMYEWRPKGIATPVVLAEMGNHAGAIGAALFAKEKMNV